jgi:hypothetical protein
MGMACAIPIILFAAGFERPAPVVTLVQKLRAASNFLAVGESFDFWTQPTWLWTEVKYC